MKNISFSLFIALFCPSFLYAQLPVDFIDLPAEGGFEEAVGVAFDDSSRMYVWEKGGRIFVFEDDILIADPLLDIREEVGNWRDHGMNGFALDPKFYENGFFYVYYLVDRHHLINFGTPDYDPLEDDYYSATILRLTRYTADAATNYTSIIPGSRLVLLGATKQTGVPCIHESHTGASIVFGTDGSLMISTGDAASYNFADVGSGFDSYWEQALEDSILTEKENVGAYRAQLLDCLDGKILRIDPATGAGLPTNPWFDPTDPNSNISKVWAMGLRNPFRATLRPGTGSPDPTSGQPGSLYVGDVGWYSWEEINVSKIGGENFGWPAYEGMEPMDDYYDESPQNMDAPNPLAGGICDDYFLFTDLIIQATLDPDPAFLNPCDIAEDIPNTIPKFEHIRPLIDFSHSFGTRTPIYDGLEADWIYVSLPDSPVDGINFFGYSSTGGVWYMDDSYPEEYRNAYYHADYAAGWIKKFTFNEFDDPTTITDFHDSPGPVVSMAVNPDDGFIYYVQYPNQIRKIAYLGLVNLNPVAIASSDINFGTSPLDINFDGSASYDPEIMPLNYLWNFGDGFTSTEINPAHTFTAPAGVPTLFTVLLTVTDDQGLTSTAELIISVNNTPPSVEITSFPDGYLYSIAAPSDIPLIATVSDLEHDPDELFYNWQTIFHHNAHIHPQPVDTLVETTTYISPDGCYLEDYSYEVILTVTDAAGLSGADTNWLFPDCSTVLPAADFIADPQVGFYPLTVNFDAGISFEGGDPIISYTWNFDDGSTGSGITTNHVFNTENDFIVTLTITDSYGLVSTASKIISVSPPAPASWNSYDVIINSESPQATVTDETGLNITAELFFYESTDSAGVAFGTSLDVYNDGDHGDIFNHVENYWTFDLGFTYPYIGYSTVKRGDDINETLAPDPLYVIDLQMFPPENEHSIVMAFIAPLSGEYSINKLACRRVSDEGGIASYSVFNNNAEFQNSLTATNEQSWMVDDDSIHLGTVSAGENIYFAVHKNDTNDFDATEIAWRINYFPLDIIAIENVLADGNIDLYPNPSNNLITISGIDIQQYKTIKILDITGKLIQEISIQNISCIISTFNFPAGLYIAKLEGKVNYMEKKFVVVH